MTPVLTAAEMKEVDRKTIELGIPEIILMENAGCRVVEAIAARYSPLEHHCIVVICGKGNNGGDGMVIARQLFTRFQPKSLHVILLHPRADTAMLEATGCRITADFPPNPTLIVDAILGTGVHGEAKDPERTAIDYINASQASVVAVDVPSAHARADLTVTFTAPKPAQVLGPTCYQMGELVVAPIGSPRHLVTSNLSLISSAGIRHLFSPRSKNSNKGIYGHVLAIAGSAGRTGAAAMCGLAALRAGAGLVTVASNTPIPTAPELMMDMLPLTPEILKGKTVVAIGPGLGDERALVLDLVQNSPLPMVIDADALNTLAANTWRNNGNFRVLTPHPGEMSRLIGKTVADVQSNRLEVARYFAQERNVILVLKGDRTLIAFPDGRVYVNPTGSPAMATGGTGDILTGFIAGFLAQHPGDRETAVAAAVYLHGLAGELGAAELTEQCFTATDLLRFLPDAIHQVQNGN